MWPNVQEDPRIFSCIRNGKENEQYKFCQLSIYVGTVRMETFARSDRTEESERERK